MSSRYLMMSAGLGILGTLFTTAFDRVVMVDVSGEPLSERRIAVRCRGCQRSMYLDGQEFRCTRCGSTRPFGAGSPGLVIEGAL